MGSSGITKKMKYGTSIKRRDILLVRFPFTDFREFKQRPVLVLSNDTFNKKTQDLVVCAITSQLKRKHYSVRITNKDLEDGKLLKDSLIKLAHIATINKSIVIKKIGRINEETFKKAKQSLQKLLG